MTTSNYFVLWEYDISLDLNEMLNAEAGVYYWDIYQADNTYSDSSQNEIRYNVMSFRYGDIFFSRTTSLASLRVTDNSFYYDSPTLYVRKEDGKPLIKPTIYAGLATGYSYGNMEHRYYNTQYYEPRINSVLNIQKNKDQFYYGISKFQQGEIVLNNTDGELDDWNDRNLSSQINRVLIGEDGDTYDDLEPIFTGQVGNTKISWDSISISTEDIRKNFTQPIAGNLLNQTDWPDLNDKDVDKPKPVAYGDIYNAKCYCLNRDETTPTYYTFLICDTEFNVVSALSTVYVDDTAVSPYDSDLTAGTFRLTFAQADGSLTKVSADFTVNTKNAVAIIKDLILNYDNKPYLSDFWDTTEVTAAQSAARNTSVYVKNNKKLRDVIKQVAFDTHGLFFTHDDGTYTIRIFDDGRSPVKIIYKDEWIDTPDIQDNADEFLSSAIIEYKHDIKENEYSQHENKDYETTAFDRYKQYKPDTFTTGLTTLSDAEAFSEDILLYRTSVPTIVSRSVKFKEHWDLELMDFVTCDPVTRISETESQGTWEVIGITKNIQDMTIKLTLREIP